VCQKHDEPHLSWTFCKPKLLPLKTFTIEKLEKLQKEAEEKLQRSMNSAD
jgi:BBSome-interacting protein 1